MALTITRNYSDGTTLTEQQLDDAFDSIETFLNVTGIGQDGLQDNSVGTGELQAGSVTADKIGADAITTVKIIDSAVTNAKILAGTIARDRLIAALQDSFVPSGTVIAFGGTSAPSGYIACDGSALSRTSYASLFAAIGVAHGVGDGSTTFNIPDYRGMFLRGRDAGAARDPDASSRTAAASGGNTGDAVGSVQADAYTAHTHTVTTVRSASTGTTLDAKVPKNDNTNTGSTVATSSSSGASTETRPINAYVLYCIKA